MAHKDAPGRVAEIGGILADNEVNIAEMKLWRSLRGGDALMFLEIDQQIWPEIVEKIKKASGVTEVTFLPRLM